MGKLSIDLVNERLKAACLPVSLRGKGNALYLRGTFPPKPGDGLGRKRYDVALRLPASQDGLKRAEREAYQLSQRLADGSFNWELYIAPRRISEVKTTAQQVADFKDSYMQSHRIQEATWANTWASTFRKLPQDEPLKDALILAVVLSTEQDSRTRELTCQRLGKLAEFAGLEIDLKPYSGDYEPEPRDIPTDAAIEEWRDRVPNERWQWVYGVMAAFGVRPHETFACEFIDPLTLKIHANTKTGSRITRAILPRWAEEWRLIDVQRPHTISKRGRACGQLVSRQFDRYSLPFVPYDLRHAWAIRASVVCGLPVSTAASMLGHSVVTHTKVYHRWLSDSQNEQVYRSLILKQL
jgi:integrase